MLMLPVDQLLPCINAEIQVFSGYKKYHTEYIYPFHKKKIYYFFFLTPIKHKSDLHQWAASNESPLLPLPSSASLLL